jgi:hypothetical protein
MPDNLTMAKPGHAVTMDGLHLSWPHGGEREIVYFPPKMRSRRIQNRIVNGVIMETDDPPTGPTIDVVQAPKLFTGEEARKLRAQPAGEVTRSQADPETKTVVQVPVRSMRMERVEAGEHATVRPARMRKSELVAYADYIGIDSSGTKADILARIDTDEQEPDDTAEDADTAGNVETIVDRLED